MGSRLYASASSVMLLRARIKLREAKAGRKMCFARVAKTGYSSIEVNCVSSISLLLPAFLYLCILSSFLIPSAMCR